MYHNIMLAFNEAAKLSSYDIVIINGDEPELFPGLKNLFFRKILKLIQLIISHIDLGKKVRNNRDKDAIVIYGFSTEMLIFTYIFSLFRTKNVYVFMHHNVQQAFENPVMRLMLNLYHHLNYKFLVNETTSVLKDLGYSKQEINQHISLPLPVKNVAAANLFSSDNIKQKKVGIVGQFRKEKQVGKTLDLLIKLQKSLDFLLIIGTNDFSFLTHINLDRAKLFDTSSREDFFAVLASCDIIVLNYEKSKYFYRSSGVAADAISARTYVVCPNFPLMRNQINYPTPVGVLYDNESDIEVVLKQALELAPSSENPAFETHYTERSIHKIMSILDQAIQANS